MEFNTIEVPIKAAGEEINISIYSDLHIGSTHCAQDKLKAHMIRRAKLPNARFILLGDTWDFVLPRDLRRYMPSEALHSGVDAVLDADVRLAYDFFRDFPIDIMHLGNHEYEVLRRHHTDPIQQLSVKLGALYGGYSSMLRYLFTVEGRQRKHGLRGKRSTTFLLHHGAWGGRVVKGFGGARDYARAYEGWDIFAYGHNHQSNLHKEMVTTMNRLGKLESRNVFYVNTGTWNQTVLKGKMGYGERAGYGPTPLNSPLVKLIAHRDNIDITVMMENE